MAKSKEVALVIGHRTIGHMEQYNNLLEWPPNNSFKMRNSQCPKHWLIYAVCAIVSSLQLVTGKIAVSKNCKITGWHNANELIHSLKFWGFSKRIFPKLFGISGLNFQRWLKLFRLQNSSYFCVFKNAPAVKQKVWNEAENRERDWGETLKTPRELRASKTLTPRFTDFFTDYEEITTVLQSRNCYALSIFKNLILWASSDNDRPMLMRQKR